MRSITSICYKKSENSLIFRYFSSFLGGIRGVFDIRIANNCFFEFSFGLLINKSSNSMCGRIRDGK